MFPTGIALSLAHRHGSCLQLGTVLVDSNARHRHNAEIPPSLITAALSNSLAGTFSLGSDWRFSEVRLLWLPCPRSTTVRWSLFLHGKSRWRGFHKCRMHRNRASGHCLGCLFLWLQCRWSTTFRWFPGLPRTSRGEMPALVECLASDWLDAPWNYHFFNQGSIAAFLIVAKALVSDAFKSFLESYTGETFAFIERFVANCCDTFWNSYFLNVSLAETAHPNAFQSFSKSDAGEIHAALERTVSNHSDCFGNDYLFNSSTTETPLFDAFESFLESYAF